MAIIKQLPPEEAQKIAAGEVIERPASIVKELLENALDAGATEITLYVEEAGKKSLRIVDNGCGMDPEDAQNCVLPHATSKIRSVDELSTVTTFGFRGEALASIAAISKLQLVTRQNSAATATRVIIQHGTPTSVAVAAGNRGTDISLEHIFDTVPARKKFLKSDRTEWHAIEQLMVAYALNYPEYRFVVYHNQQQILNCTPCTSLLERAGQLLDQKLIEQLIPLSAEDPIEGIKLTGLISHYQYSRYDRGGISCFVNKRWVKNHKLGTAIIKGYQDILPTGQYPYAIIKLTVPPATIDINMHPRKEEVLFMRPRVVEQFITRTVHEKLASLSFAVPQNSVSFPAAAPQHHPSYPSFTLPPYTQTPFIGERTSIETVPRAPLQNIANALPLVTVPPAIEQQQSIPHQAQEQQPYKILGRFRETYILLETATGLMLIDQHAAHERVLYEQFGTKLATADSVQLAFPEIIDCSPHDHALVVENTELLAQFGIGVEPWATAALKVTHVPLYLATKPLRPIMSDLITQLRTDDGNLEREAAQKNLQHNVQAMLACKAAVKANDKLSYEETEQLVRQLFTLEQRLTCPHGRPTSWTLSNNDITKMFQRDYR